MANRRNILVITLGDAPGVVTETIWYLMNKRVPSWVPHELHLVTTTLGAKHWSEPTTEPRRQLDALMQSAGQNPLNPKTLVPTDATGKLVADIRTEAENVAFATDLTRLVKRLSDIPGARLHVSMAGGRKTMSSYAQQAISFCGRDGDELTHILIDPPQLEYNRTFFWPGQMPQEIDIGTKDTPKIIMAADAVISMVPSPFVRLRQHLKRIPLADSNFDYSTLVESVQASVDRYALELDIATRVLRVGRESVVFTPLEFALFRVLVTALKESWLGFGPDGFGDNHCGWVAIPDFENPNSETFKRFFEYYHAAFPGDPDESYWKLKEDVERNLASGTAEGVDYVRNRFKGFRRDIKERMERSLKSFSSQNRVLPKRGHVPRQNGRNHFSRYGLPFEAHEIDVT